MGKLQRSVFFKPKYEDFKASLNAFWIILSFSLLSLEEANCWITFKCGKSPARERRESLGNCGWWDSLVVLNQVKLLLRSCKVAFLREKKKKKEEVLYFQENKKKVQHFSFSLEGGTFWEDAIFLSCFIRKRDSFLASRNMCTWNHRIFSLIFPSTVVIK